MLRRAATDLRALVPHDAAAWLATDPATGLPTSPFLVEGVDGLSRGQCARHWEREHVIDDVNLFRHLSNADVPAAAMRSALPDPEQSPRYRSFVRPLGFADELRGVLRSGDAPWGTITLFRRESANPFTRDEVAMVASLADPIGEALRRSIRASDQPLLAHLHEPGLMLFAGGGELISADERAWGWLEAFPPEPSIAAKRAEISAPAAATQRDHQLPVWLLITVLAADAIRHGCGDGTARTRTRTRDGRWLACHASCLPDGDGGWGPTALVIEPAKPSEVAPIVAEAFGLSERERQIVALVARGAGTSEIARELFLSPHTVRDHVKAMFAKVGVSTRGELVARVSRASTNQAIPTSHLTLRPLWRAVPEAARRGRSGADHPSRLSGISLIS